MTDWDAPLDDPTPGQSGMAFIAMLTALAWLICAPFDLYVRLRNGRSTTGDDAGQSADWCGADWGSEHLHNETGQ